MLIDRQTLIDGIGDNHSDAAHRERAGQVNAVRDFFP